MREASEAGRRRPFGLKSSMVRVRVVIFMESAIFNRTKDKLYRSQALNIIDEKVKTLKEINNVDIKISIEDVINDNGDASGTTVIIQFGPNN